MPRVTLMQNLPPQVPSAVQIKYTYYSGAPPFQIWNVTAKPNVDTAVTSVDNPNGVDLVTEPNVASREMILYYPQPPNTLTILISSVRN